MADTFTTNLNLVQPEVGASDDSWGTKINNDLASIDSLFDSGPVLKLAKGGTGAATAAGARTALGLGTIATVAAPAGAVVGTTDTQTLTNKTIDSAAFSGTQTGDFTTTGKITIDSGAQPSLILDRGSTSDGADITFKTAGGNTYWQLAHYGTSGDFALARFVSGTYQDTPIYVYNSTGDVTIPNDLTVNGTITFGGSATNPLLRVNAASGLAGVYVNAASGQPAYMFFARGGTESGRITVDSLNRLFLQTGSAATVALTCNGANVAVAGALSKGSGSFNIPHPLPSMADTHRLVHSFVEAPTADNIYRGRVSLVNGAATVDLDEAAGMTKGTQELLNGNWQVFVQNESGWSPVRGRIEVSTLHIECQDATSTDTVSWLAIGSRQDQHMLDTDWTDDFGRPILEPLKPEDTAPVIENEEPVV